ncbi:MAG: hypothetical protein KatS3mg035_2095 [Bacteroidia bacterium]|nr:MAG: hypothetical protein KatS3mg035_2095 [Bacteroidia bacterium]
MQEILKNYPPAAELSLKNLAALTQERLFTPIVKDLYAEFVRNGTNQALVEILNQIPTEQHLPILHTLTTHVTKEKPVFIYGIGIGNSIDINKARFVAASTDLLWCLSLMVDDIIDRDHFRADKKTAWRIYGEQTTYKSADIAFQTLQGLKVEICWA